MTSPPVLRVTRTMYGTALASYLTLAVLVLGSAFIGVAGPRQSLHIQTRALQDQLATVPPLDTSVQSTADWNAFTSALSGANGVAPLLYPTQLGAVTGQLASDFSAAGLPLARPGSYWAGLTTHIEQLASVPSGPNSTVEQRLELIFRDPLERNATLITGQYPGQAQSHHQPGSLGIALTQPTARELNAHVGTTLRMSTASTPLKLVVTGIVRARQPRSAFWTADITAAQPVEERPLNRAPYWVSGAFFGPSGLGQVQDLFGSLGISLAWTYPLTLTGLRADQAATLQGRLGKVSAQAPALAGALAPASTTMEVSSPLGPILGQFLRTADQVNSVLSLLFASLAATGVVVILLAAWMLAQRRSGEFTVLRARGATVRQLATRTLRGTVVSCLPAALAGAALGILVTPGEPARASWWLGGLALVTAVIGPALAVAWQHRVVRPEHRGHAAQTGRPAVSRRSRRTRRLVAELALAAAAVGGLVVLRAQGATTGAAGHGGLDLYTSLAPVLVAVPAVLLAMRLAPLAVRGLLRLSTRRGGPVRFLGLAQAARAPAATILPLFAVVLALTLAAFTGMLRDAVSRGETAASWRATGADAVLNGELSGTASPAAQRAAAAVPGVQHATAIQVTQWALPGHGQVSTVAIDPASYPALLASTPWPALRPSQLAVLSRPRPGPGQPVPVLASPAAAAALRGSPGKLSGLPGAVSTGSLTVRVAGLITGTPALPGGGAFVLLPLRAAAGSTATTPAPANLVLLSGGGIDGHALHTVARRLVPGASVTLRSDVLASLGNAPLQHGAYVLFAVVLAAAAAFGLAALLADLALGAVDRHQTLARLATMGVDAGQARRLVLVEKAPALLAAAVAGTACALVLPTLTASALNLSVFTGAGHPVPVRADWTALAIPVAGLLLIALVAATMAARTWRGTGVAGALRIEG